MNDTIITVSDLVTRFGSNVIHDGISLSVRRGEIYGLLGGSGSGKSTLLKQIIMLLRPESGQITLLGHDLMTISDSDAAGNAVGSMRASGRLMRDLLLQSHRLRKNCIARTRRRVLYMLRLH